MNLTLHVWRQRSADDPGRMERYLAEDKIGRASCRERV